MCETTVQTGYTCQTCGVWVAFGAFHSCQTITYPAQQYCVCCPQFQKLNALLDRLEKLLKQLGDKNA